MQRQPLEVQTIYAELLEQIAVYEASRTIGHTAGSFVTKMVKGQEYCYFQSVGPGGSKRQTYLGRRDAALDELADRFAEGRVNIAADQRSIERLAALLRAGGAMVTDAPSARVLRALADAGVFHSGGVLVGTHAFIVLGNLLGVRWATSLRTQDVDIAADRTLDIAVPGISADLPSTLDSLEMGFLPVPGLDPKSPTTSFKVRGQSLRVDLLTPSARIQSRPVRMPRFAAAAQPLRFLDYLIDSSVRAAVVDGGVVAVNVPDAARFALHKLMIAGERPAAMQPKREKDLSQAAQILEVMCEDRPGDLVIAWEALVVRGKSWTNRVAKSISALDRISPVAAQSVRDLAG
ncbi:MAG: GSU2403 family nucleotidyltransferase fold protein [Coriobacteriia bacterium]|nr:GSU2403 family nucleotidyltransferase fold protein [Coriobacteriia bacterium]